MLFGQQSLGAQTGISVSWTAYVTILMNWWLISCLYADIQTTSGTRNCCSTSTPITQSFASCKIPNLSYFLHVLRGSTPSFIKIIVPSLPTFLISFQTWFIMTYIWCRITTNIVLWRNVYIPLCNAFWQPVNLWAMLASSFLHRAQSVSTSNP